MGDDAPRGTGRDRPWEHIARALGRPFDEEAWRDAASARRLGFEDFDGVALHRFDKDAGHVTRGSVVAAEGFVATYPHIGRALHLQNALAHGFHGPIHVEEKIDGYNVRYARLGGRVLGLSRSGHVCPFATDRARDFPALERLLSERPGLVVCAELAGPGSPYNTMAPPWIEGEIELYAFDVGELNSQRFLPPLERVALLERYGVPAVRAFGVVAPEQADAVHAIAQRLDAVGGEGVVLKALDGGLRLKYPCLRTSLRDLTATAGLLGDVSRDLLVNRIVQYAFTLHEWEAGGGLAAREGLGAALLDPLLRSIAAVERDGHTGQVDERFEVRFHDARNADRLVELIGHASSTLQVKVLEQEREADGRTRLVYVKRYQRATGYFLSRLSGGLVVD